MGFLSFRASGNGCAAYQQYYQIERARIAGEIDKLEHVLCIDLRVGFDRQVDDAFMAAG